MSGLAVWSLRLAFFSLAATIIAVIIVRSGALDVVPAVSTLAGALVLAVVAILLAFAAIVSIWFGGYGGLRQAVAAALIGFALIAYPAYLAVRAYQLPAIYDVTTDPIDPPQFDVLARLRPRDANPIGYEGLYAAQLQQAAYPDIQPDETSVPPQEAFDAVLKVIERRRWHVVDARPPQQAPVTGVSESQAPADASGQDGIIEAVAHSLILGFPEDVVVRIRPTSDGARIDIRSASRYGRTDLGSNAERVRELINDIDDLLATPEQEWEPRRRVRLPNQERGRSTKR